MSRPTPETDAFAASEFVDKIDELTQLYDLSEKLERERDEARDAFVIATDQMVIAQSNLREANKERDEARGALMRIEDSMKENTDYNENRLR
jgi:predicted house-cleaning NTP pyrophosphatase (Maf/HAM1 superfamily)